MKRTAIAVALFVGVTLAAFLRDPGLFITPRFWAEEGASYFQSAVSRGTLDGLLNLAAAPHNSYFHALPLAATVLAAHAVPLEFAPFVTTLAWVAVFCVFEAAVLTSHAAFLESWPVRTLVAASPLLAVGAAENWANTLGAHFYLDVAMLLLLLEGERATGPRRAVDVWFFALFAIASPTSFVLLPAVLLLGLSDWRRHRPFALTLAAVALFQASVHWTAFSSSSRAAPDAAAIPHVVVVKLLAWPFLGRAAADAYGDLVSRLAPASFAFTAFGAASTVAVLLLVAARAARPDSTSRVLAMTWCAAGLAYVTLGLRVGREQLSAVNGGRYAFLPSLLLIAFLAHQALSPGRSRRARAAWAVPLALVVITGMREYSFSGDVGVVIRGAPWRTEVERFRRDATYETLRIAPIPWVVKMPAR